MHRVKSLMVGLSAAIAFLIVAAILLRVMPKPLKPTDSMVIGSLATLAALVVLFIAYMTTTKQRDIFYKKRPKPPRT
jgi:hypothetical protein